MKDFNRIFVLLFLLNILPVFSQTNSLQLNFTLPKPDYRNHKNIPEYDPALMPLQTRRPGLGVWTELNPKVPRVDYIGIHFVNKDTGWACGAYGIIIKTIDGGKSWTVANSPVTSLLLKIHSYNAQVVIATGYDRIILRSTDGGENFTQVQSGLGSGTDFWGLQMLNDTLGWICGNSNSLIKTINGGLTWQRVLISGYTSDYWWIDFMNEKYGFIAANGRVLKTGDGGMSWAIIPAGDPYPLFAIDVIDSLNIAAAGYGGAGYPAKNIYSSNGGFTWINGGPLSSSEVNCIQFTNVDTGYLVQGGIGLYKTTNRGQNWNHLTGDIGEFEFSIISGNVGYSVGTTLKIFKAEGNLDSWKKLLINENFRDVFFVSEQKGFAISSGINGILLKTEDGGFSWEKVVGAPGGNDIVFTDSLTGFIAGNYINDVTPTHIYKTTNGGINWNTTNISDTIGSINKIFFINQTTGWAATGYSPNSMAKILKTLDGGENWFVQVQQSGTDNFISIFFIDSLSGWAASRYIWQTTNGGINWIQRTDIPAVLCNDVYFFNSFNGWIIATNRMYYTTDGGNSWILDPHTIFNLKKFENISNTHFIITGINIYESIDTGKVWQNITSEVGSYFTSLHAPKDYLAYGVGTNGYIVKYFNSSIIPVELSQFTSELLNNKKILLSWITESETNNFGFEVFRSNDLIKWEKRGFVSGVGTTALKSKYTFLDDEIFGNKLYYKLKQIDYEGSFYFSETKRIDILIDTYFLLQNYPNPFNPTTTIGFGIAAASNPSKGGAFVTLKVYDILGNEAKTLVNDEMEAGYHSIDFNASELPSGVYFYRIKAGSFIDRKKMMLIK